MRGCGRETRAGGGGPRRPEGRFGKETDGCSPGTAGLESGAPCSDPRRPAGGTRRIVSAFHPPPALQVGRLRPGEGGGNRDLRGCPQVGLSLGSPSSWLGPPLSLSGVGVTGGRGGGLHLAWGV